LISGRRVDCWFSSILLHTSGMTARRLSGVTAMACPLIGSGAKYRISQTQGTTSQLGPMNLKSRDSLRMLL
jgi:hypothetical protein